MLGMPILWAMWMTPVAKVLVETFGIGGVTNPEEDIKMFMA